MEALHFVHGYLLQEESAAVEELSTLLQLAQAKKQKSNDKLAKFIQFRSQMIQ